MNTRLKILVADEELDSIGFVTAALEGDGHEITAASSHAQALVLLARARFDVIMFDVWDKKLPGLRLFKKARELHEYIEGIVMTGAASTYTVLDCYRAGIIDCLAKPLVNRDAVRRAIARTTEKRAHWQGILETLERQQIEI